MVSFAVVASRVMSIVERRMDRSILLPARQSAHLLIVVLSLY